jgi:Flp pilus assembly protein TadG
MRQGIKKKNLGVYTIEFVLLATAFLFVIFMLIELGRIIYLLNAAGEVTRRGARVAVVCNIGAAGIVDAMATTYPNLTGQNVNISYLPAGCNQSSCQTVTVALTGLTIETVIGVSVNVPNFSTTLPRESLNSTTNSTTCT